MVVSLGFINLINLLLRGDNSIISLGFWGPTCRDDSISILGGIKQAANVVHHFEGETPCFMVHCLGWCYIMTPDIINPYC